MKGLILIAALVLQEPSTSISNVLSGQISFFDGNPAPDITVVAVPIDGPASANRGTKTTRTDATGLFRFESLAEGSYYIQTVPVGPHTFFPGVATEAEATPVTIAADSVTGNLNFRLTRAASGVHVRGRVVVPDGQMLQPDARVRVVGGSPSHVREAAIEADGTFDVSNVRPGGHTITLSGHPGMAAARITVEDRDLDNLELVLPRAVTVRGTVTMAAPGSLPQLHLTFTRQNTSLRVRTQSRTDGSFQIGLPVGLYAITIDGLPPSSYVSSVTSESVDLQSDVLQVEDSVNEKQIAITLGTSGGVDVDGRISVDGSIEANIAGQLIVGDRLTGRRYETEIQTDGSFQLSGIMPGKYAAAVLAPGEITPPVFSLTIPQTSVGDMEISVPGLVEISGRLAVEGGGPPPKFQFALVRASGTAVLELAAAGQLPVLTQVSAGRLLGVDGSNQILQVAVNALADGTFKFKVPAGEYRMATIGAGIPEAFLLRSVNYGSARLLEESMIVSAAGPTDELQFGFSPSASNPWITLSGTVIGVDAAAGPWRVALEGVFTSTIETPVNTDGSFEFRTILRDSTYTAGIVPAIDAAPAPRITVTDQDLSGVILEVPRRRNVIIRTVLEGGGPIPSFMLSLAASTSVHVTVTPGPDGTYAASLPEDERRVGLAGLPFGYVVKAMTYGSADLMKARLKIFGTPADTELRVLLSADPVVPFTNVQGRISGLTPDTRPRLVLYSAAAIGSYETTISEDGTFDLSHIPQGLYVPAIVDGESAGTLSPSLMVVSGPDTKHVELTARPASQRREPVFPEPLLGARVTDLGGPSAGGDAAAVAALRTINTALVTFLSVGGRYGNIGELIEAGLLDESFRNERGGYRFAVIALGNQYAAAVVPTSSAGQYGFFSTPDGIVRYSTVGLLAPPDRTGTPVQ